MGDVDIETARGSTVGGFDIQYGFQPLATNIYIACLHSGYTVGLAELVTVKYNFAAMLDD